MSTNVHACMHAHVRARTRAHTHAVCNMRMQIHNYVQWMML